MRILTCQGLVCLFWLTCMGCSVDLKEIGDLPTDEKDLPDTEQPDQPEDLVGPDQPDQPEDLVGPDQPDQPEDLVPIDGPLPGCESCDTTQGACVTRSQANCAQHAGVCAPLVRVIALPGPVSGSTSTNQYIRFRLVDDGPFLLGCTGEYDSQCESDEQPLHQITMGAYYLQETEVTVEQFARCVESFEQDDEGCSPANYQARSAGHLTCNYIAGPADISDLQLPMNCINRAGAEEFCQFVGGRLPTEAQWEKAARGGCQNAAIDLADDTCYPSDTWPRDNRLYPWGDQEPDCSDLCWTSPTYLCTTRLRACPAGSFAFDLSPYTLADLGGNLSEWVMDDYNSSIYSDLSDGDICPSWKDMNSERTAILGIIRGGNWQSTDTGDLRVSRRTSLRAYRTDDNTLLPSVGFRCLLDVPL
ncbi:MAG: formylglycine-generating enzyme family protein [Bradymonadales bacterium]|nr:formylglycine-generating enzyme family protein [Bradymonadales bacterium]